MRISVPELAKSTRPRKPSTSMATFTWPPSTEASSVPATALSPTPPLAVEVFVVAVLSAKLASPLAVMTALMLMSLAAVRVNLFALHDTASLTLMSPEPLAVPLLDKIKTSALVKADASAPPDILATAPSAALPILKSAGSINQVPVLPSVDKVDTFTPSAILTWAALVSMKPPSPPPGAEASNEPSTLVVPTTMPLSKIILPA